MIKYFQGYCVSLKQAVAVVPFSMVLGLFAISVAVIISREHLKRSISQGHCDCKTPLAVLHSLKQFVILFEEINSDHPLIFLTVLALFGGLV